MDSITSTGPAAGAPEPVAREAARQQLGQLLGVRPEESAGSMIGKGAALFAGGLTVSVLIALWNHAQTAAAYAQPGTVHTTWFFPAATIATLTGLALVIRGLAVGTRVLYLYTDGLVNERRSGLRTVRWSEVTQLKAVQNRDRTLAIAYRISDGKGPRVTIPMRRVAGQDALGDHVLALLRRQGRAVG